MKNRAAIIAVLLVISIGNFSRLQSKEGISPVQFISIFAIGALSSLLIREIALKIKGKS